MRFVPIAAAGAALLLGAGAAQATLYCDPYRPNVCVEQPDPPAHPPSVTYSYPSYPPRTTYTYRVDPPPPPPQVTYEYQAPPAVTVQPPAPYYPPRGNFSVRVD